MESGAKHPDIGELRLTGDRIAADSGRIPGLDGLRAVSIAIVLLGHFFLGPWGGLSALGVYLFFIISGFLITRLLLAEGKRSLESGLHRIDIGHFYFRRILRLYPVLFVAMAILIGTAVLQGVHVPPIEVASVFFYFANYYSSWLEWHGATPVLPIDPLWSLAVEEHFYLLFPLVVVASRGKIRPLLIFSAAMLAIPLGLRFLYVAIDPALAGTNILYRMSETRFDSLAYGVLLAVLCETDAREKIVAWLSDRRVLIVALIILLLSYIFQDPYFKATLRYTMRSAACMVIVAYVVFGHAAGYWQRLLSIRWIEWLGRISYSLYIWHAVVPFMLKPLGLEPGFLHGALCLLGTFLFAVPSYYLIERQCLRLKGLWKPRVAWESSEQNRRIA